ncbi:MAG: hypothetical protein ACKOX6_05320 [Bdellovibrio sp.]
MRQLATITLSGLIAMTALVGCKEESRSSETRKAVGDKSVAMTVAEFEHVPNNVSSLHLGQQCYYNLCGETIQQVPNIVLTVQKALTPSKEQETYYQTYIEPILKKMIQAEQASKNAFIQKLTRSENQFAASTFNPTQARLIYFLKEAKKIKSSPELAKYLASKYIELDFYKAFQAFNSFGKFSYFQKMYPQLSLAEAYSKELSIITPLADRVNKDLGISFTTIDPLIVSKITRHQELSIFEVETFTAAANNIRQMDHFLFAEGGQALDGLLKQDPLNYSELYDTYKKSNIKQSLLADIKGLPEQVAQCKGRFFQSINLYPQQTEIDAFAKKAETVRQVALEQISPQDPAYAHIQSLKLVLPASADENTKNYLRYLTNKERDANSTTAQISSMSDSALFALALLVSNSTEDSKFECPQIPSSDISDQTVPADGFILVSWFSVRYPQVGATILSHEMGHTVFAYSNSTDITRQCLKEKKDNSEQYLNEDFADYFAAKSSVKLHSELNTKALNFGCALVGSPYNTSLLNMNSDDPHSSPMYRAIQLATHSGQVLPDSCQQMLQQGSFQSVGRACSN